MNHSTIFLHLKFSIAAGLLALSSVTFGQGLQEIVTEWVASSELKNASVSISVVQLDKNKEIASHESNKSLIPASTQKLFTTAAALRHFDANAKFNTQLIAYGPIREGTLYGDLVIVGGGDPSLGSSYHQGYQQVLTHLVEATLAAGIRSIQGRIVMDDRYFGPYDIPRTWIWEDMGNYYGAGACGLTISDNKIDVYLHSEQEGSLTEIYRIEPEIPGMKLENFVTAKATGGDQAYIFGAPFQMNRTIRGTIPVNQPEFKIKGSMPDPAVFIGYAFRKKLEERGVFIKWAPMPIRQMTINEYPNGGQTLITEIESLPMKEMVWLTNTHSLNLYAEHLLNQLGKSIKDSGTTEQGVVALYEVLENLGVETKGLFLVDGSGLSRFNALSARHLTELLHRMRKDESFKGSLAVAGVSGTLKNMLKDSPAKGKLIAKSGYMERVRSYAGYVTTQNGEELAFAIMVNNYTCTAGQMKRKMESLMDQIARQ